MTGQEIFRAEAGQFAELWHQEDVPGMLRQLGLGAAAGHHAARRPAQRPPLPAAALGRQLTSRVSR